MWNDTDVKPRGTFFRKWAGILKLNEAVRGGWGGGWGGGGGGGGGVWGLFYWPTKIAPTSLQIKFEVNPVETLQENSRKSIYWPILALFGAQ